MHEVGEGLGVVEDERHDGTGGVVGEGKTGKVNGYDGWRRGVLGGVKYLLSLYALLLLV